MPPDLTLVVPCHNEASRLDPDAFLRFATNHSGVRLVLVDDGSVDGTGAILERMRAAAPEAVSMIRLPERRGKAEAVRAGILAGLEQGPQLVGFFDADLATPLATIDDFLTVLRLRPTVEFVLGSRVMLMGRDVRRKAVRHYLGRVFATAASHALDLPVYDTQCGAKILRVTAGTASLFATPFRSRWVFDVELIARYLRLAGCAWRACPARTPLRAGSAGLARQGRIEAAMARLRPRCDRRRVHLARTRGEPFCQSHHIERRCCIPGTLTIVIVFFDRRVTELTWPT